MNCTFRRRLVHLCSGGIMLLLGCDSTARDDVRELKSQVSDLSQQVHALDSTLSDLRLDFIIYKAGNEKGGVDFTSTELQEIGDGFHIGRLSLQQHLTGVKVSGRIINATALDHSNVAFRLTIGGQSKEFTVGSIDSKTAASFDLYVPDVPIDKTRWGNIQYLRSRVSYFAK